MTEIGYSLSSEEHSALDLVRYAERAEQAGFQFALISDHFHPWMSRQGQSPFVWSVIGAIAVRTHKLRLGTGVTCPLLRIHPAIVAQAAATAASMMPGRFFLGVGTGENLNEHILGDKWPPIWERQDMLQEAVTVIRQLWKGGVQNHQGRYFTVENAQIFSLPSSLPPIYMAAAGSSTAELAARIADGLISVGANAEVAMKFGKSKPRYAQVAVCWAESEKEARKTACEWWPITALSGPLTQELALPSHFEAAAKLVTEDKVAEEIVCGPDPSRHIEALQKCIAAGFDHVYIHQIGKDQEGFFKFYQEKILPHFGSDKSRVA